MLDAYAQPGGARKAAGPPMIGILAMGPQTVFRELPTYARCMKTAKTLGLTVPQSVLLRADRVIE